MAVPRLVAESADISPIEEIIAEARAGRPFILVDSEDRENEGDLIVPAQFATPEAVNFMAVHGRGLICLSLTADRIAALRLPPMAQDNRTQHGTAFTVSIEAREGITTGISAHDRARTIQVAADPDRGPADIVSPGHVFPLAARDGGVLVRAGHTEASIDIARLAGLRPAAVICEIMNDDGTMARLPDLLGFAARHGLKIGTIADLIAYRRRTERHVVRELERDFDTIHGRFRLVAYRNLLDNSLHIALARGVIDPDAPVTVRMHRLEFGPDVLGMSGDRHSCLSNAMKTIADEDGPGVIVLLKDWDPDWLLRQLGPADAHTCQTRALRDYGIGAQILIDLGVRKMVPITSARPNPAALPGYGLTIVGWRLFGKDGVPEDEVTLFD
ncbi:3,4-dihydroxy-2-butanone 4-phosphate synthase [Rhizorhabdus wittichii RW1]|uniref:3,4-dihydroxy-2-butanone 4-phosphate synthase n=2 Tax=Rhizorhabdus wittichii TaxID=160791 RepID=A0A9J9LG99_RHIWR|nr:3,4-dihydroxy-2-butanone 4-phosphate synthase [Rhizorhabdus wittichii RW1]